MSEQFDEEAMNIGEDIMTKKEWIACVKMGIFIPYDGSGYWGNETHFGYEFDAFRAAPAGATHVHWFNK